jgi:hypothetical protein
MLNAAILGGVFLMQTKYSFIQKLSGGLPAQIQLSLEKSLPWHQIQNWPITINVCLLFEL